MDNFKKLCVFFFASLLICLPCFVTLTNGSAFSSLAKGTTYSPKTVKVAMLEAPYFLQQQPDGSYTGIVADYLQEISKYAGWKLEYISVSYDELDQKLTSGEIDLTGGMLKNDFTMPLYDFADYTSGYSYTVIKVLKGNKKYVPMDYSSFNGMRIGIFRNAVNRIPAYHAFVESNGLQITPVYFDENDVLVDALQNGEIDAILSNDTSMLEDEQIIAKFNAVPYYFATRKGNSTLLRELNFALSTILEVNPKFDDMIYEKNFNKKSDKPLFSTEELSFIETSPPLKVAIVTNLAPIEYYNNHTGTAEGVTPDILHLISSRTGLSFEFVRANNMVEAQKLLYDGDVDLITGLGRQAQNDLGIVFTKQYLDVHKVLLKNPAFQLNDTNVFAALDGYPYSSADIIEGHRIVTYDSVEDCIQSVISGDTQYTLFNNLIIEQYIYLRGNDRIMQVPITNVPDGLSFGLLQPATPALLTILDKAIYSLTTYEIQNIVYENTTASSAEPTLTSMIYSNPIEFVLIAVIVCTILLFAIVFLVLFMRTRLKLAQQVAIRGNSYRIISELTDEYIFDFDYETKKLTIPQTFAGLTGRKTVQSLSEISNGTDEVMKTLFSIFAEPAATSQTAVEFECALSNSKKSWFKAVGTVLTDTEKNPIRGIGRITSIQKEMQEKRILQIKATTDALTGLYNRQYSEQKIMEYFDKNQGKVCGALMVIDLDFFKTINDTLGHLAGDQLLIEFAKILTSEFHSDDIIGRWGGDEFIAFMCNVLNEDDVVHQAQHLCQIMNRDFHYEGKTHRLSISVGVAVSTRSSSYTELFKNADTALYAVKKNQRNGFQIY